MAAATDSPLKFPCVILTLPGVYLDSILTFQCNYWLISDPKMASINKRLSVSDMHRRRSSVVTDSLLGLGPSPVTLMSSMFAFAYVWAFGGHLHNRYVNWFSRPFNHRSNCHQVAQSRWFLIGSLVMIRPLKWRFIIITLCMVCYT